MIRGNTPKCGDCKYYTEPLMMKPGGDGIGLCRNEYQCGHGINGHRRSRPLPFAIAHKAWAACV